MRGAVVFEVIDPQRLAVEALAYDPLLLDGLTKASAPIAGGVLDLAFVGLGRTLKEQAMPVLFRVEAAEKRRLACRRGRPDPEGPGANQGQPGRCGDSRRRRGAQCGQ
jgi:hypothetical protein